VEEITREPIELTESELDEVAGGNPFSFSTNIGFNIGNVFGDQNNVFGANAIIGVSGAGTQGGVGNTNAA